MVIDQLRGGPAFATKEQRQIKSKDIYDIIKEKENVDNSRQRSDSPRKKAKRTSKSNDSN